MMAKQSTKRAVRAATSRQAKPRDLRKAERRDAILSAALDEFSAQGYAATRLEDVANRAGVAKGTIYLYFRDKEALFQELVRTMLTPVVGSIEALRDADIPMRVLADRLVDLFVNEIFGTRRREVIRLLITDGRRFPKLAEFYYREVLSRVLPAMRALLSRAAARGEIPEALAKFPQLLAAPGLVAVVWTGLFDKYEPLDVRAMMQAHIDLVLGAKRSAS
jgi:AcrR family transcriptional regulator